jgi:hypothetical protein
MNSKESFKRQRRAKPSSGFRLSPLAFAALVACAQSAHAADGDVFSFSGFGTAGLAHSSEDQADVHPDSQTDRGVGASRSVSANLDSRLGFQVNANFTDDFSAVAQVVSEYAVTESYKPKVTLAHVKYRFTPHFSARLGRISAPLYALSEYQRVGYALPWARAPQEVYDQLLASDGIEGLYSFNVGDTAVGVQAFYGHIGSERIKVDGFRGVGLQVDRGASSFHLSHVTGTLSYETSGIEQLFAFYGSLPVPQLAALAHDLDPRDKDGTFDSIGYSYDPGSWFLRAEAVHVDYTPSLVGRVDSGYLSAGLRRGKWTPSFTFAHADIDGLQRPGALDPVGLLNQSVDGNNADRHSFTAALRWDVRDNVAVKLQDSYVKLHAGSYGYLDNLQPGFQPGGSYNLVSASVDFVF